MAQVVEALYIPKSVTLTREGDAHVVRIKATSAGNVLLATFLFFFAFIAFTPLAFASGWLALLVFVGAIGWAIYLMRAGSPVMRISPAGVEVRGLLYRAEDASHFADHADDGWLATLLAKMNVDYLALSYGIYNIRLPYILSSVEVGKVAVFLTQLLKSKSPLLEAERERKIQQSQSF